MDGPSINLIFTRGNHRCMDKKVLTAIILSLMMITSAPAVLFSDDSSAYDTTGKISDTKNLTFTGTVRYNISPPEGQEPNIIVLIATQVVDPLYMIERLSYVEEPSKVRINADGTFSLRSYRILNNNPALNYYFLVESGYEIEIVSSSLSGDPETVYRYNTDDLMSYAESYTAFKLTETVAPTDSTFKITGKNGVLDKIGAIHATGTFSAITHTDNYRLANAEVRLLREGETDIEKYAFSGTSDSNGVCTIKSVSTGVYTVVTLLENYDQAKSIQVNIVKDETALVEIDMDINMKDNTYWGFDLPHFLMLCSGVIVVVVIAVSVILQRRAIKGKGGDWFINDVKEEDDDDETDEDEEKKE